MLVIHNVTRALVGLFGVIAAALTFLYPGVMTIVLIVFIETWAIARGVIEIVGAIPRRNEIDSEWLLTLCGARRVARWLGHC